MNRYNSNMERVSFKVAKAIKEAGYPQDVYNGEFYYAENGLVWVYDSETYETLDDAIYCSCPLVMKVWCWLWREKEIKIVPEPRQKVFVYIKAPFYGLPKELASVFEDPEEAIIAAIEYLIDNNLIK